MVWFGGFFTHGIEDGAESLQAGAQEDLLGLQPVLDFPQRLGVDRVGAEPDLLPFRDKATLPQNLQMLEDTGPGHVKVGGDVGSYQRLFQQLVQNVPANRAGQGAEHFFVRFMGGHGTRAT